MSRQGPITYQDPSWFQPKWSYSLLKHDLQRYWPCRNNGGWARGACRDTLKTLRAFWPKGTVHPDHR